ncbi:hypothetical protein NBRGN_045_00860 [Nocardia brasiliensis NBRC 14402]|uniref:hypothetical protein n=1 Tax=Nocardia brasiliensis TaxID=37326 RepID=UPI000311DF12|nr:hypothetical protein [Nocardia brasiliensis]ASF09876.1 hypothetical protein CEQ30_23765 [Nocardia brasiliensis]GAJ81985.1 hypothetical protein NBRGN_045_00860 [Nocardia brasiliensis NBRC 14402]SUB55041.1 Uncharacterised protein [Nocardia brasiliensis]
MSPVYVGLTDKAFLRFHHGHGVPVISQTVVVLANRLTEDQLRSMYEILCAGPSMRRVHRPAVPFARWRWVPADAALPLSLDHAAIDECDMLAWANTQAHYPLDPENGYGWRMSAVPTRSGGMVWSVIASHAIADGHAGLMAIAGLVHPELATTASLGAVIDHRGDLLDGLRRSIAVARGVTAEVRRMARDPQHRAAVRRALTARESAPAGEPLGWREGSVVVTFDAAQWNARAAQRGGSPNTLYLAMVADLLRHCALVGPDGALVLLTAVRILREQDQADSNSFARVPIVVDPAWLDRGDLAPLRLASKAAFANAHDVGSGAISRPRNMPVELIDVLPEGVVERLAETAPITVGMCSNMGVVDSFVPTAMRHGANPSMFMMRGVFQGIDAPRADRQPIALATWFSQFDGKIQWVLESLKPEMAHSDEELVFLARLVAESWDLKPLHVISGDGSTRTTHRKFS